jgi:N-acetylneuraminate lyase
MLTGVYPAIFTPFDDDLNVDFEALSAIIDFQLAAGVNGFFVTGSTGEGLLLSLDERLAVIKHVIAQTNGRGKIIAHVGHPSTQAATALAIKAASAGADWIASVTPIYHGTTFAGTFRHYRQIATATDLPFMAYSLGSEIIPERDCKLFDIPNLSGLKYTNSNYFSVQQLAAMVDRPISIINGMDELFVGSLSFGFHGGIGSTYNFAPAHYVQIFENYQAGNIAEAARLQAEINKVTQLMIQYENWSYRKAIMRYIGYDCGPCRPPYAPLSENAYADFAKKLDALNVLKPARQIETT